MLQDSGGDITAIYSHEELCWVKDDGFYYGGEHKGAVTPGAKTFASLGDFIIILPDKAYYNVYSDEFGSLESTWSGTSLTFTNGQIFGVAAEANTIQRTGVNWSDHFKPGDAVEISGATQRPANNKTAIIREIDGDKLHFSEYAFRLAGTQGTTAYTETGSLSVSRKVPDLIHICESSNRLWGCDSDTIYASVPGDIFNFNVFDGTDMDAWAVDVGSPGVFTGCVSFLGYPVFFKQDIIYKVFGMFPSDFELVPSATLGVAEGSSGSLAIANEVLYYLSRAGVVAYSGGIPQPVGLAFGTERFNDAVAGSDGLKYYISMDDSDGVRLLYVYDSLRGMWHIEDAADARGFTLCKGRMYFLNGAGEIWCPDPRGTDLLAEEPVTWNAEFADWTDDSPNRKAPSKLQVRLELEIDASVDLYIRYDSAGDWQKVRSKAAPDRKRSYYLALTPRRADHYRLKFEGIGGCRVYSLTRERYIGSELINV